MKYPGGRYLVVLNMDEARIVCDYIEQGGDVAETARAFRWSAFARVRLHQGPRAGGHREPDHDAVGRVARDRGGVPAQHGAALRRGSPGRALPHLRHDLLGDAGAAGRGDRRCSRNRSTSWSWWAATTRATPCTSRPWSQSRGVRDLSHRGRQLRGPRHRHHPPPAGGREAGSRGGRRGLARRSGSGSPPARRRPTTRSARRSRASRPRRDWSGNWASCWSRRPSRRSPGRSASGPRR